MTINNAGIAPLSLLESQRIVEWDQMIDVNSKGVLYGIAAALPHMKRQKSRHIINVSSLAAYKINPATAAYSATKAAVRTISESPRQEIKPYNIRTTMIAPGAIATELPDSINDANLVAAVKAAYNIAIPPESFARVVTFAISQPEEVDVNEALFTPTQLV